MKQVAAPAGVFILLMAVYLWTMAPGTFWIDSAAFTACNEILGLPHPPGFPLYTVLGRTVHALIPANPATVSNIYSALTAAAGGAVLYLILSLLLAPLSLSSGIKRLASMAGAIFAFLTIPVWQSAVRAEVYSLQALLALFVVYLYLKTVRVENAGPKFKYALAAIFVQGLSFTNHSLLAITTVPLVVALPFFIGWRQVKTNAFRVVPIAALIFCLAMSLYLYLPLRSNRDPAINSGQPKTIAATVNAITRSGEDYLPAAATGAPDYLSRTGRLAGFIFDQTGGLVLLGIITSIFITIRKRIMDLLLLSALIPIGLATTIWAADFQMLNFDIVAYSSLPLIILIVLAFYGLCCLTARVSERVKLGRVAPAIFVLMVFFQFTGNLYAGDLSGTAGPDKLAEKILEEAPSNAILLLNEDNVVLPLWYHCHALGKRPDVSVISAGALYRPSYRNELRIQYPDLEYPEELDAYRITDLNRAISSFCELNKQQRPIMVQFGVPGINADMISPRGFLFLFDATTNARDSNVNYPSPELLDHIAEGATDLLTRDFVARYAFNFGVYFDRTGQTESAYRFFQYAIEADDENPQYLLQLGIAFLKAGKNDEAILLLQEAVKTGRGCPEAEGLLKRISNRKYGKL